jgi:two-component system chemotaxis response regulator CheY
VTVKVLVVDDSKAMRMIVKRNLGQVEALASAQVVEAEDGRRALELIRTDGVPDLVLSDWNMPDMTGIELLQALRADGSDVRFGFVTSETQAAMREQAIASGALFLLAKPFNVDEFRELVESVF